MRHDDQYLIVILSDDGKEELAVIQSERTVTRLKELMRSGRTAASILDEGLALMITHERLEAELLQLPISRADQSDGLKERVR
jgi:hypothetical protein